MVFQTSFLVEKSEEYSRNWQEFFACMPIIGSSDSGKYLSMEKINVVIKTFSSKDNIIYKEIVMILNLSLIRIKYVYNIACAY